MELKNIRICLILVLFISCQNIETNETKANPNSKAKIEYLEEDSLFLELVNTEIITNLDEKKYISDITQLRSIKLVSCDSMRIHYKDIIKEKQIELILSLKKFEKKNHKIKHKANNDESINYDNFELIDGNEPWGGYYGGPGSEIDKIEFQVDGNYIEIENEFKDIFDLNMCNLDFKEYFNPNPLLKYDGKINVFYLYVKGGNAANTYFGKFVFNEKEFIKRYLLHYGQLSESGSFRRNFKGF